MLVHFCETTFLNDSDVLDYDNFKVVSFFKVKSYDVFVKFIKALIHKDICVGENWYTVEDYALSCPMDSSYVPVLRVFVISL